MWDPSGGWDVDTSQGSWSDSGWSSSAPTEFGSWGSADPIDFYTPMIESFVNPLPNDYDFGDFARSDAELSSPSGVVTAGPKAAEGTGGSFMDGLRRLLGFGDDPKSRADFGRGAMTIGAGLLAGAAAGWQKGKQMEMEKKALEDRRDLNKSQIALNESKTRQQGLENMQFNTPQPTGNGLIAARFIPVSRRATA